ncbi:MAG: NAD(P)/FAD-dependent oxidoreductase [Elusimicrobiota bacterium]
MRTWDAVVAGGGPASLSAGFYLSRAGFRVLLVERDRIGGKLARLPMVRNYPGFPDGIKGSLLARRMALQAERHGLSVARGEVSAIEPRGEGLRLRFAPARGRVGASGVSCRAVIVATGSDFLPLGLPGEDAFRGRGLFHAAFGDAARFAGKTVGVVGGGEAAAHQALALAEHARRVFLFARGRKLAAIGPLREGVRRHPRIVPRWGTVIGALEGNGSLSGVSWARTCPASGRAKGRSRTEPLDALFVLVGQRPSLPEVRIRASDRRRNGVFVAGDADAGNFRQAAIAAADGLARAMECERYLKNRRRAAS